MDEHGVPQGSSLGPLLLSLNVAALLFNVIYSLGITQTYHRSM
jgi:hypothetical protein